MTALTLSANLNAKALHQSSADFMTGQARKDDGDDDEADGDDDHDDDDDDGDANADTNANAVPIMNASPRIPLALQKVFLESNSRQPSDFCETDHVGRNEKDSRLLLASGVILPPSRMLVPPKRITLREGSGISSCSVDATDPQALPKRSLSLLSPVPSMTSPHEFLMHQLQHRGYPTHLYSSLACGYLCHPTPLQLASYGTYITSRQVLEEDTTLLTKMLRAGISPNPCNKFGESLMHTVCRRGHSRALSILLRHGASVQVTDDYGRTPLHDACWRSQDLSTSFDLVTQILLHDPHLICVADKWGKPPLDYIPMALHQEWIDGYWSQTQVLDRFWPASSLSSADTPCRRGPLQNKAPRLSSPRELTLLPPYSRTIPDPTVPLPLDLAAQVAGGKLHPDRAEALKRARLGCSQSNNRMGVDGSNSGWVDCNDSSDDGCDCDADRSLSDESSFLSSSSASSAAEFGDNSSGGEHSQDMADVEIGAGMDDKLDYGGFSDDGDDDFEDEESAGTTTFQVRNAGIAHDACFFCDFIGDDEDDCSKVSLLGSDKEFDESENDSDNDFFYCDNDDGNGVDGVNNDFERRPFLIFCGKRCIGTTTTVPSSSIITIMARKCCNLDRAIGVVGATANVSGIVRSASSVMRAITAWSADNMSINSANDANNKRI
jgi:hypothetical protein